MPSPSRREHQAEARPWNAQDSLLRRVVATGARLLGAADRAPIEPRGAGLPPAAAAPMAGAPVNPAIARAAWADRHWGEGMAIPGGAEEVLRLAALLPLTPAHTLLIAGVGAGATGAVVTGARGCFISAHDLDLAPSPPGRRPPPKRVTVASLSPAAPAFRVAYHQYALLLEPFRGGGAPEALLRATAAALRDGGEVVMLDLVASGRDADARWLAAEGRPPPPSEAAMPEALERAGFRVHVVEDAGARHHRAVLMGWIALLEALRTDAVRPTPQAAAALVAEAEAWLLRLRMLRDGRLRLLRWHATMVRRPG